PGMDVVQPRRRPVPHPLVRRGRAEDPAGPAGAGHAAGHDRALLRRRDQWDGTPSAGFPPAGVPPWLPVADSAAVNVASQRDDPASVLHLCRELLRLRKAEIGNQIASYQALPAPPDVWAYRIGPLTVVGNFSDHPASYDHQGGTVLLSSS